MADQILTVGKSAIQFIFRQQHSLFSCAVLGMRKQNICLWYTKLCFCTFSLILWVVKIKFQKVVTVVYEKLFHK